MSRMSLGGQHTNVAVPTVSDVLARSPLFGVLTLAEREELTKGVHDVALAPGEMLFSRGDPGNDIYLVVEGRIRISVLTPDGRELSFDHAVAGDIFGEIAALDGASRSADATAITPVRLKVLSGSALQRLLSTSTGAAVAIIKLLCDRLRNVSEHFEAIAMHPIEVRLARLLLDTLEKRQAGPQGCHPVAWHFTERTRPAYGQHPPARQFGTLLARKSWGDPAIWGRPRLQYRSAN